MKGCGSNENFRSRAWRYFKKLSQLTVIMFALYLDCVWLIVQCIGMIMRSKSVICECFQRIQTWNVVVNLPHWTVMDWKNDIFSGGGISIIARGSCIYQWSLWLEIIHLFSLEVVLVSSPGGLSLFSSLWSYMMTHWVLERRSSQVNSTWCSLKKINCHEFMKNNFIAVIN